MFDIGYNLKKVSILTFNYQIVSLSKKFKKYLTF